MRIRAARPAIVDRMTDHRRAEVEAAMQELIAASGLEPPDSVEHEPSAVVFKWTEPKLAVIVDLKDRAEPLPAHD
jgi:hypothetical protein